MFTLTEQQINKIDEWAKTLPDMPTGSCGGRFTFCFTPTSIGTVVNVKAYMPGGNYETFDATDYDTF